MPTLVKIQDNANFGSYKNVKYYPYIVIIASSNCSHWLTWSLCLANWLWQVWLSQRGAVCSMSFYLLEMIKTTKCAFQQISHGTHSQRFPSPALSLLPWTVSFYSISSDSLQLITAVSNFSTNSPLPLTSATREIIWNRTSAKFCADTLQRSTASGYCVS